MPLLRPGQAELAKAADADQCVPCVREQGTTHSSVVGQRARADALLFPLKEEGAAAAAATTTAAVTTVAMTDAARGSCSAGRGGAGREWCVRGGA